MDDDKMYLRLIFIIIWCIFSFTQSVISGSNFHIFLNILFESPAL